MVWKSFAVRECLIPYLALVHPEQSLLRILRAQPVPNPKTEQIKEYLQCSDLDVRFAISEGLVLLRVLLEEYPEFREKYRKETITFIRNHAKVFYRPGEEEYNYRHRRLDLLNRTEALSILGLAGTAAHRRRGRLADGPHGFARAARERPQVP